jgi:hypothetical protein
MANMNKPDNSSLYTVFAQEIQDGRDHVAKMDYTGATNIPTGAIRWSVSNERFEKYNGSTWDALSSHYEIDAASINGLDENDFTPVSHVGAGASAHATATQSAHGFMSSNDKIKLDNAVADATANRLIIRDANGRAKIADPSAGLDIANKQYVDGEVTDLGNTVVKLSGNQTIAGVKTFSSIPVVSASPTVDNQLARKKYVDDQKVLIDADVANIENVILQQAKNIYFGYVVTNYNIPGNGDFDLPNGWSVHWEGAGTVMVVTHNLGHDRVVINVNALFGWHQADSCALFATVRNFTTNSFSCAVYRGDNGQNVGLEYYNHVRFILLDYSGATGRERP